MPVKIWESRNQIGYDIAFYEQSNGEHFVGVVDPKSGELIFEPHVKGANIKPTLQLSRERLEDLVKAAIEMGVKTETESTIRGKHEAQTDHLADLQHLIGWFLNSQKPLKPIDMSSGKMVRLPFGVREPKPFIDSDKKG